MMGVQNEQLLEEINNLKKQFEDSLAGVHDRLDKQDLNHAAEYLREFGYFLERNPNFMRREKEREERTQERDIAFHYFARLLHLTNWKSKASWLALGIATGFLFALGNALYAPFGGLYDSLHQFVAHLSGK